MATNGASDENTSEIMECDGEQVVTMMDVLQEQEEFEQDANAVLGASDDKECTYSKGYIKRQAIYACMTCCEDAKTDPSKRAGVCLACSLNCHENHELIELYTKRNFRCDCGNPKFESNPCQFTPNKNELNEDNKYNQNFSGLYCICHRPYPDPDVTEQDEMIQCIICEDWLHASHLEATVPGNEQYSEMICKACMDEKEFLHDYSEIAVNVDVDVESFNNTNPIIVTSTSISEKEITNLLDNDCATTSQTELEIDNSIMANLQTDNPPIPDEQNKEMSQAMDDIEDLESKQSEKDKETSKSMSLESNKNEIKDTNSDNKLNEEDKCANLPDNLIHGVEQNDGVTPALENISAEDSSTTTGINNLVTEENISAEDSSTPTGINNLGTEENISTEDSSTTTEINNLVTESNCDILKSHTGLSLENEKELSFEKPDDKTLSETPDHNILPLKDNSQGSQLENTHESPEKPIICETQVEPESTNLQTKEHSTHASLKEETALDESKQIELTEQSLNDEILSNNETEKHIETVENMNSKKNKDQEEMLLSEVDESKVENSVSTNETKIIEKSPTTESSEEENLGTQGDNASVGNEYNVDITNITETSTTESMHKNETENVNSDNKRKLEDADTTNNKKAKLDSAIVNNSCVRPRNVSKIFQGATFWPSNFRQKLCTCGECITMYKDLSVLFLIDPEDTVTAYETLGKEKNNGSPASQYEKGLEALSSLDRVQQINALTEYNKMRDKLLDFLKSFKDRKEIVKEEDIKAFFAGMKPKREPDGVYFCR